MKRRKRDNTWQQVNSKTRYRQLNPTMALGQTLGYDYIVQTDRLNLHFMITTDGLSVEFKLLSPCCSVEVITVANIHTDKTAFIRTYKCGFDRCRKPLLARISEPLSSASDLETDLRLYGSKLRREVSWVKEISHVNEWWSTTELFSKLEHFLSQLGENGYDAGLLAVEQTQEVIEVVWGRLLELELGPTPDSSNVTE